MFERRQFEHKCYVRSVKVYYNLAAFLDWSQSFWCVKSCTVQAVYKPTDDSMNSMFLISVLKFILM